MKTKHFTDKEFYRKLFSLTLPIAFQSFMLAAVAAADAFMLGRIEQNSMSAVSLASQIQFIQNMILTAATSSAALLGAQYWGKKDVRTIEDLFSIILKFCTAISFLFFLGCQLIPEQLMFLFTNEEDLIRIGAEYLRIAGWSYLATGISQCYLSIMKVSEHPTMTAVISSTAVVLNIILNALFIYGLFGLPSMGAKGAATATLIARIIELIWCILVSHRKSFIPVKWKYFFKTNGLLLKDFVKCGLPILGAYLFWGVGFTSYTAFMGHLGTDAAAANSVTSVVRDLICCVCTGLAVGAEIMVGNELGAGNLEKGKLYGDRYGSLSFLCGFGSTVLMLLVTPLLIKFVTLTDRAKDYLLQMMLIMAFYMIGRCVNTIIINGVFTAGGDTMFDFVSLSISMWGLAVPLAALGTFVLHWPVWVVYACTCLDEVGKIPFVVIHFKKYKWVKDLTRDMKRDDEN